MPAPSPPAPQPQVPSTDNPTTPRADCAADQAGGASPPYTTPPDIPPSPAPDHSRSLTPSPTGQRGRKRRRRSSDSTSSLLDAYRSFTPATFYNEFIPYHLRRKTRHRGTQDPLDNATSQRALEPNNSLVDAFASGSTDLTTRQKVPLRDRLSLPCHVPGQKQLPPQPAKPARPNAKTRRRRAHLLAGRTAPPSQRPLRDRLSTPPQ
ncbi:hypothetical protein A1Q2_03688 [Trichosporon asahii var. asahii CBS 8904]|uniref:Uncharacterized protein n=1 Tax=Trichosporon asahii var. asahii (strain CBS 8904) TaxID=1220162 RepID=K1VYY4_TRIAC|nr:hypothetical protein A1Q2_03688 [Trichosporon asahii var. asahii CBS 8904]